MEDFQYQKLKKYSTGELADMFGVHQQTIRKWCDDFSEYIVIPRDETNQRYFTDDHVKLLTFIKQLKDKGENIHVIKKVLANSKGVEEIKEQSLELTTVDKMTGEQLKDLITKQFTEMMIAREQELKEDFELKLEMAKEEIIQKQLHQIQAENNRLIDYIAATREEDLKKSFWQKLFGK